MTVLNTHQKSTIGTRVSYNAFYHGKITTSDREMLQPMGRYNRAVTFE